MPIVEKEARVGDENPYRKYPGAPVIIGDVEGAISAGTIVFDTKDNAIYQPKDGPYIIVPPDHQLPIVKQTIEGLLEDLAPSSSLADLFRDNVLPGYTVALEQNEERPQFGWYVYYPQRGDLVTFAPPYWHEMSLLARNSLLIRDPAQTITREQQREVFEATRVGVAGASVGKNALLRVLDTLYPAYAKIGDLRAYKPTNANRTDLAYWEIGENKAIVAAQQAHRRSPFVFLSVYQQGLHTGNIDDFVNGRTEIGEPNIHILIEETDDPDIKIFLRQKAKAERKIVIMITDIGTAYQIDVRNWRDNSDLSLAVGVSDDELLGAQEKWHRDKANRELFFKFAFKLIGDNWKWVPEFRDLILKRLVSQFAGGVPQLGAAAHAGASHAAIMIAQKVLGELVPERTFHDMRSRTLEESWLLL